ncbi:MAG: hypothetical protein AAF635_14595, partial [Cyanobacteria bacterium P01_C01_bin.69]
IEQNVFQLGVANDPFKRLAGVQASNPYKLSIISKLRVQSKNAAALIETLGHRSLGEYTAAGGWFAEVPDELVTQFTDGHYLRSLARRTGAKVSDRTQQATPKSKVDLRRLTPIAKQNGLTFAAILEKVEQAYDQGVFIDDLIDK